MLFQLNLVYIYEVLDGRRVLEFASGTILFQIEGASGHFAWTHLSSRAPAPYKAGCKIVSSGTRHRPHPRKNGECCQFVRFQNTGIDSFLSADGSVDVLRPRFGLN